MLANPVGPAVVNGTVGFATAGKTLTVTNSPSAILNWQGFSIARDETTRFVQQSAASAVLNRVVGQDPSAILGTLNSNGRVFLLNPNGIVFGAGSRVDVAGLVASTLNLSNQDFLAGRLNFEAGAVANPILNHGNIATPSGGRVYLIAPNIENHGVISTPQGQTLLAAGKSVQLVEADVPNLRVEVQAGGEALNVGQIIAEGGAAGIYAGLINQRGIVRADSVSRDAAGRIVFRATGTAVLDAGSVTSASGGAAGGSVDVQADVLIHTGSIQADGAQGGNVAIQARNVLSAGRISADGSQGTGGTVNVQASGRILQTSAAHLSADGTTTGGKVTLQAADRVFGSGTLTAIGQGAGSTGGEIRVLGNDIMLLGASLDASGDAGGGTVLIGGDFQGNNPAVQNARINQINFSTTINADARTAGSGGKVIVWSDKKTEFYGTISARGGAASGDGGFIEVSGKESLVFGGMADAGAPNGRPGTLLLDPKFIVIDSAGGGGLSSFLLADPNPGAGDGFAQQILVLPNNNVVATDPNDDLAGVVNGGAVYLFNGTTGALVSTITGINASDQIGSTGIAPLTGNNNFVVRSNSWNGSRGAVTWGSGVTGFIGGGGAVSATNSLVGSTSGDGVGGVTALSNGNYVVTSASWDNVAAPNAGAVTFGSGTTGVSGVVSVANSLVGTTSNDQIGSTGITPLTGNNNFVVRSNSWNGSRGAVTWGSGVTGFIGGGGAVSAANSLVGTTASDQVGSGGVTALSNGNYVVRSPNWDGTALNVGAVTWGNGLGGTVGPVSSSNSLVGSTLNDGVGGVTALLTNGNYVVSSPLWNGTVADVGAVTWVDGSNGRPFGAASPGAVVSMANSLVGSTLSDGVGGVTLLTNGNYVVSSPLWNGTVADVGAVTWGNGAGGTVGPVSSSNSLVGSTLNDKVGDRVTALLTNGNYVVQSPDWNGKRGAATWGNGLGGTVGPVSSSNSLVGSTGDIGTTPSINEGDQVGGAGPNGLTVLSNGNYVVRSGSWDNGTVVDAGAVTFGSGTTGVSGAVSAAISLVGSTQDDAVGAGGPNGLTVLTNGSYLVKSSSWDNGTVVDASAVTFGSGTTGVSGAVSAANSLVGSTQDDGVGAGNFGITVLTNGSYLVRSSSWNNGTVVGAGAVTFGSGTTGVSGAVSAANSLVGSSSGDVGGGGTNGITVLSNGNYLVRSSSWDNGTAAANAGAVTFGSGTTGVSGAVSAANSLVGSTLDDGVGGGGPSGIIELSNGSYVVRSSSWNNGTVVDAGAVTFGSGTTGVSGAVSAANSLVGTTAFDQIGSGGVTGLSNGSFVVRSPSADNGTFIDAGLVHLVLPFTNPLTFAFNAAGNTTITPAQITAITNTGTAVTLQANTDITLAAASNIVTSAGGAGGAITMQAGRSILLNSSITTDNGNLTIIANEQLASGVVDAQRDPGAAVITMAPGTTINTGSGNVTVHLRDGAGLTNSQGGAITLGGVSAAGLSVQNDAAGGIIQNAPLTVAGASSFIAGAAPIILTNASNDFQGAVTLSNSGAANTVSITDANTISFASMTLGGDFTVTAPSIVLSNVTNTGFQQYNGAALINGAYVTNGGAFNVTGATTVGGASTINAGAGAITLTGAVDSALATNNSLALFSSSVETFGSTIGATQALSSISTDAPGTVSLGGNVTTTGAQSFNDAVTAGSVTLTSTGGGAIFVNNASFNIPSAISTTGTVTFAGPLVGTSGAPLALLVTPAGLLFTQVATAFLSAPSIPAAITAPTSSSITINGGLLVASTAPIIVEIRVPPPPPQVLPPPQQQAGDPPAPEAEFEPLSDTATGSADGTTPVDDGAGTRKRRVPRC